MEQGGVVFPWVQGQRRGCRALKYQCVRIPLFHDIPEKERNVRFLKKSFHFHCGDYVKMTKVRF